MSGTIRAGREWTGELVEHWHNGKATHLIAYLLDSKRVDSDIHDVLVVIKDYDVACRELWVELEHDDSDGKTCVRSLEISNENAQAGSVLATRGFIHSLLQAGESICDYQSHNTRVDDCLRFLFAGIAED